MNMKWVVVGVALALGGCAVTTPAYQRPALDVPTTYEKPTASTAVSAERADPEWWKRFGSEELNELIDAAVSTNHDLGAATARIDQARATAKIARSRLSPQAGASVDASRGKQTGGGVTSYSSGDDAALTISYEVDFWGKNSASNAAARARLAASEYDRDAVRLVLEAEVASTYFQALALKDRLVIARQNLDSARQLMSLVQSRYDNGAANGLEVAQQRTALLGIEADVPTLEQSLTETQSALAVLLGRAPQGFALRGASLSELTLPSVEPGQPAELLERRPDVAAAEATLLAANADVGAARAELFPSIDLGATAVASGWLAGGPSSLASLATSLAQTVFDGGNLRGQVASARATRQELVETYLQTLLTSLREAHDSLSGIATAGKRAELLRQTIEQAREAYRLAGVRYQSGSDDLLTLLDSQQSLLSAEDGLAQARLASFNATAQLFKALGGGWSASGSTGQQAQLN